MGTRSLERERGCIQKIDYGNKIASTGACQWRAFSAWRMDESRDVRAAWELGERVVWGAGKGAVA